MTGMDTTENIVIKAVCISAKTGMRKKNVGTALLIENYGIKNDAHANSTTHRQVSLLAMESIQKMKDMGLKVGPGDFAENLTTEGVNLLQIPIGSKIKVGKEIILEVTQHGKECHTPCAIYYHSGTCVFPTEGIFVRIVKGGVINAGDNISKMEQ